MNGASSELERTRLDAVIEELVAVLREIAGGEVPESFETRGPETIRRLGLTSVRTLEFIVALEDRLGVEWDEGLDPDAIASFEGMAEFVLEDRSLK